MSVQQRELDQTEIVNAVIEGFNLRDTEIIVVLLVGVPNHVKIASKHPRGIRRGREGFKFIEKIRATIGHRSIDVGDVQRKISKG
jgi:hypothetical protein